MVRSLACSLILFGAANIVFAAPELIQINDAGNPGEKITYGAYKRPYARGVVNYPYKIGKREVTNSEYAEFLNATAKTDSNNLYNSKMAIVRTGNSGSYSYAPKQGTANKPVSFITRVNAARYCNWLSGAEVYKIANLPRENGKVHPAIIGWRNLTTPTAPCLYYIPNIHEFHKAAFYDGNGKYRKVTKENRSEPSHYGLGNYSSGTREWVEDKYYGGATILLGAVDKNTDSKRLNGITHHQCPEYKNSVETGFRIAATGPLSIAPKLNTRNNYFINKEDKAILRLRSEKTGNLKVDTLIRNFRNQTVYSKTFDVALNKGVNDLTIAVPQKDGYYELVITPHDPSFNGQKKMIPLMVMRKSMPDWKLKGNFGYTVHITRWEKRFTFEKVDFNLLHRLGAGIIRVDVRYNNDDGNQTALKRIKENGFRPLGIITAGGINSYSKLADNEKKYPELVKKWATHGVPAMAAWYAENVYNLVKSQKAWCHDWELGNEPTYWRITSEDYAQIEKAGYIAAKLADPDCNVMIGDINAIHPQVLAMRSGDFCNSIASHIYGFYVPAFWGIIGKMRSLNGWKAAAGIPNKPVWLTEIGVCTYNHTHTLPVRTLDEIRHYQSVHVPKTMAGGMAFGAAKILNYNYRDVPVESLEEEFGMIDRYGMPKPAAMSYRTTARLLGNATFAGFMKGHSDKQGGIAGLLFKQPSGKKVLVLWRNDTWGDSEFKTPFEKLIKPPVKIKIPAANAKLVTLDGNTEKLSVSGGAVTVPVDEYPVFISGDIQPELTKVKTASDIQKINFKHAKVAILPPQSNKKRACDLVSGIFREFESGQSTPVTVHIYNLQAKPLKGSVKLVSPADWRTWEWDISPKVKTVEIPAGGMASITFTVKAQDWVQKNKPYYLGAVFESAKGIEYTDRVQCIVTPKQVNPSRWITYSSGFKIDTNKEKTLLELSYQAERKGFGSFYLKKPMEFVSDSKQLNKQVSIKFNPGNAPLHAVSLMFIDGKGEFFQIKKNIKVKPDQWITVDFDVSKIITTKIHYGGNNDGKVDFPVRILGFNFDIKRNNEDGKLIIEPYKVTEYAEKVSSVPVNPKIWITYSKGFKIGANEENTELKLAWQTDRKSYGSFYLKRPKGFAQKPEQLKKQITLDYNSGNAPLYAISLMFIDKKGEFFQIKRHVKPVAEQWNTVSFDTTKAITTKIHYGGNKDGKIDYPIRFLGFNFDIKQNKEAGEIKLKQYKVERK